MRVRLTRLSIHVRTCALLVPAFLIVCSYASSVRGEVVTAAMLPTGGGGFSVGAGMAVDPPAPDPFDNRLAQTFVASVTGTAHSVSFTAHEAAFQGTTAPLRVDIAAVVAGQPAATLATAYVPIAAFPSDPNINTLNINADFSASGLLLQEGTAYSLVFSTDTANANYRFRGSNDTDPYPSGTYFRSQNGSPWSPTSRGDLWFQVTVTPVPEPSGLVLAGLGCLTVLVIRRHRRSPACYGV